jgi:hypothetical protein
VHDCQPILSQWKGKQVTAGNKPLVADGARHLLAEWGVTERQLGCLLRLGSRDVAELLGGAEPSGLDFAGALRLGVLTSALDGISMRRTRAAVRAAIAGGECGGAQARAVFEATDLQALLKALEALEATLAKSETA